MKNRGQALSSSLVEFLTVSFDGWTVLLEGFLETELGGSTR